MKKISFKKISILVLVAIPILFFFVVSGNGKFDWDKVTSKTEKTPSQGESFSNYK